VQRKNVEKKIVGKKYEKSFYIQTNMERKNAGKNTRVTIFPEKQE